MEEFEKLVINTERKERAQLAEPVLHVPKKKKGPAQQLSAKKKKWVEERMKHMPYIRSVINCLGAVHSMARRLQLTDAQEIELIVETQKIAMDMADALDVERPFCDRAIAKALLRMNERAQKLQEASASATIAAT